jgi:hypothetical protein
VLGRRLGACCRARTLRAGPHPPSVLLGLRLAAGGLAPDQDGGGRHAQPAAHRIVRASRPGPCLVVRAIFALGGSPPSLRCPSYDCPPSRRTETASRLIDDRAAVADRAYRVSTHPGRQPTSGGHAAAAVPSPPRRPGKGARGRRVVATDQVPGDTAAAGSKPPASRPAGWLTRPARGGCPAPRWGRRSVEPVQLHGPPLGAGDPAVHAPGRVASLAGAWEATRD